MNDESLNADDFLPAGLPLAFAPVHKTALGIAVGLVTGLLVAAITAFQLILHPPDGPNLELLSEFFYGYTVTWTGTVIGMFWGFVAGFVAGWFAAFVRNFVLAASLLTLRVRAGLSASFLDHI